MTAPYQPPDRRTNDSGPPESAPPGPPAGSASHTAIADRLAAAAASLGDLGEVPVGEHVARYDAVHAILQDALTSIDSV